MLKFSANISLLFTELPLVDRIKAAADHGFEAFELHFPYETPIEDLVKAIETSNIKISLFNLPAGDFSEGGPGIASISEREAHFRAAVAEAKVYAEALKPEAINILAGSPPRHINKNISKNIFAKNIKYASERLSDIKSLILIEPINYFDRPNYLINTTYEAIQLIKNSQVANVKVLFDIYHMHKMREDIINSMSLYKNYIGHIQFADCPGRNQPGTGKINFQEIFKLLEDIKYNKWLGAEYNPKTNTTESFNWLDEILLK